MFRYRLFSIKNEQLAAVCVPLLLMPVSAKADPEQDARDIRTAEVVMEQDLSLADLQAQLLRLENVSKRLRTQVVLSDDIDERSRLSKIVDARTGQASRIKQQIAALNQDRELWTEPKGMLDARLQKLEAQHRANKDRINKIRASLADDLAKGTEEARKRYFDKLAQMDALRNDSALPELERLRVIRSSRFSRLRASDAAMSEDEITGNWVDRACATYPIKKTGGRFSLTRTISALEGRWHRTYIGNFAKARSFQIDYAPDIMDLKSAYGSQVGADTLDDADYQNALDLGLTFSANIQFNGEGKDRNALVWPIETEILYEKDTENRTKDIRLSQPQLSEVAIELRPDLWDLRLTPMVMEPEIAAGEILPVVVTTSNFSRCKHLDVERIRVTGTYIDEDSESIEGLDLVDSVTVSNLPPRGWDSIGTQGPFVTQGTAYLLPEKPGRLRISAELVSGRAKAKTSMAKITSESYSDSKILDPAMTDEALGFLDNLEDLSKATAELADACSQQDRVGPSVCQRMRNFYIKTGSIKHLTNALEDPMVGEKERSYQNGYDYLKSAQVDQDTIFQAQKAAAVADYFRTVSKGYADIASALSTYRANLGFAKKLNGQSPMHQMDDTIRLVFKNLYLLEKMLGYGDKLTKIYSDPKGLPKAKGRLEDARKLQKDTTKIILELEAIKTKYEALQKSGAGAKEASEFRVSLGKIALRALRFVSDLDVAARSRRIAEDAEAMAAAYDIVDDRVAAMKEINRSLLRVGKANQVASEAFKAVRACYRKHCGNDRSLLLALPPLDANGARPEQLQKAVLRNVLSLKTDLETQND